jgi:hypothetical protein
MDNLRVKVRALCPMSEESVPYKPGDEFETTLTRAEALGDAVTILLDDGKAKPGKDKKK